MRKRTIVAIGVLIALLAAALGGFWYYQDTYTTIGGQRHLRNTTLLQATVTSDEDIAKLAELQDLQKLDLRGSLLTTEQFDALQAALPGCEILWQVGFQGSYISSDMENLTISSLSQADIEVLRYLPNLTAVDARECSDYPALAALMEAYPQLDVTYSVTISGQSWPQDTTNITVATADPAELEAHLKLLPQVTAVNLTDIPSDLDAMLRVQTAYPAIRFHYPLEVCGVLTENTATELDLSGIPMTDTAQLENCLKYMPNLTKVDMCDCGISNEEMEALNNRHENTLFVWIVNIGPYPVRTDITYYIPVKYQQRVGQEDCQNLRYCTELVALDLGHMPIVTCEFVSYMPHLKYLIMADSSLTNIEPLANLKELVFLEVFLTYVTDYSPLLSVTSLEDLNICHTHGDMEPLTQMTWLKRLWWGGNPDDQLSDEEHEYLQSCLPNTTLVTDLVYSTGRGWRQGGHYYDMRDYFGMWYMDQD